MVEISFRSQIATTIEQSERLIALGLRKETADMCWLNHALTEDYKDWRAIPIFKDWEKWLRGGIPAWSLHRLWELANIKHIIFDSKDEIPQLYDSMIDNIESQIKEDIFNKNYLED